MVFTPADIYEFLLKKTQKNFLKKNKNLKKKLLNLNKTFIYIHISYHYLIQHNTI